MNDYTAIIGKKGKIAIISLIVIVFLTGFIKLSRKNITFQHENEITEYKTFSNTVDEFLKEKEISIKKGGYINYSLNDKLENDMHIVVRDPKRYNILVGEELKEKLVSPHTKVKDILKNLNINLDENDYTEPSLDSTVKPNDTIKVFKVKEVVETKEVDIPYETVFKDNKEMDKGSSKVIQAGSKGKKTQKIKTTFINDKVTNTEIVKEEILQNPTTELKERGTRQLVATSRGSTNFKSSVVMTATAYDNSFESTGKNPGDRYHGMTASGTRARVGAVAVDPRVIPLGTRLYIESLDHTPDYGYATAEDTGGAIKGNKIDLFFNTKSEVYNFGRRKVKVYILN